MNAATRKGIFVTALLIASGTVMTRLFVGNTTPFRLTEKSITDLRLIVVLSNKESPDYFNRILDADDIAFTFGAKMTVLSRISVPETMLGRGSIRALEEEIEKLGSLPVDYIQYNPEQWKESHTPREEIDDLIGAVRKARKLAAERGAGLSFTTDYILLDEYGERVAPLVDLFGIQMQRYQREELDDFRAEALRKHDIVRRGSRTVPIFFQVSLAPPLWEEVTLPDGTKKKAHVRDEAGNKVFAPLPTDVIIRQIDAIKDLADGIALLYDADTTADRRALVAYLRGRK